MRRKDSEGAGRKGRGGGWIREVDTMRSYDHNILQTCNELLKTAGKMAHQVKALSPKPDPKPDNMSLILKSHTLGRENRLL